MAFVSIVACCFWGAVDKHAFYDLEADHKHFILSSHAVNINVCRCCVLDWQPEGLEGNFPG